MLAGLAAAIYGVDSDIVAMFTPMRAVVLVLLLLSAGLLALRLRAVRSAALYALLGGTIVLAAFVYVREFAAYREIDLAFENDGVPFAGTLYLPPSPGSHPGVVIAQGSIRAPRRIYHLWADRLAREGIAVYSFDKRGTGASGGNYEAENNSSHANLDLLASDVRAAVEAMRHRPEVDAGRVGILGLSMGGWLGPLAAQGLDSLSFMVLVSGPTVSVGEENYYSDLTGEGHGDGDSQAAADSLVAERSPSGFDPRALLRASSVPTLWLFGGEDLSIPVAKSVAVLDSMIAEEQPYRYVVFPEAGHLGFVIRWPFDLAPGLWDEIVSWVDQPHDRRSKLAR